ncbi:LOW QUALITY PROTEIN: phospholipid-transporting ATPase ABCA3 [Aphomia sociella]
MDSEGRILRRWTLLVLLWKQGITRISRFFQTIGEWFSPIVFIVIVFLIKNELMPIRPSHISEYDNVKHTDEKFFQEIRRPQFVLYTPSNEMTDNLMAKAAENLGLNRNSYNLEHTARGYNSFVNEALILDYMKGMKDREAIVIFQNGSSPNHLNYTIRMKTPFQTNIYESMDGSYVPHMQFGTIYETFASLQWAIDKSYLENITGKTINQSVSLQEFPYVSDEGNSSIELMCEILTAVCWLSLVYIFVILISRLVEERLSGIQELMEMVGVSSNLLGISQFMFTLPAGLIYSIVSTVLLTIAPNPIIANSNWLFIHLFLQLHFHTVVAMAFATSYVIRNNQYVVSIATFIYLLLWVPAQALSRIMMKRPLMLLTGLLPNMPIFWFWKEVAALEKFGQGLTFNTIMNSHSIYSEPVSLSYVFMVLQCIIFYTLAWYLNQVVPGPHGQALPWNFMFKRFEKKVKTTPADEEESVIQQQQNSEYFENDPFDGEPGIKIENVSKNFPKHRALHNVSFNVYKDKITVLLGHNGAGKTTLMSIITGMMSASAGKVEVNNKDSNKQRALLRRDIGLCPQHNLFFADLTVLQHVVFFTMLKGVSWSRARAESLSLLQQLGLAGKQGGTVSELSGGMKRRLQLACALAGDARVLVLDEPTSGLDVETRRALWNLLLSLRGQRTVLLTTHFLEEADALADRVAVLHAGELCAYATPMYLKKAVGTGYRLSLTTTGIQKLPEIDSIIKSNVKDSQQKQTSFNTISYDLPAKECAKFPALFNALEEKREELNIETIGVGVTTLEEVFLKLTRYDKVAVEDEVDGAYETPKRLTGCHLYGRQFCSLFQRQLKYMLFKKYSFFLLQFLLPVFMIWVFTRAFTEEVQNTDPNRPVLMNFDIYNKMRDKRALYNVDFGESSLQSYIKPCCGVRDERSADIANAVIRIGKLDKLEYNKYLVGIELNDTDAKVLYTTTVRHAMPVAMNALSNMLAMHLTYDADKQTIATYNHPIQDEEVNHILNLKEPKNQVNVSLWAITILFIIQATCIDFVALPSVERSSGTRHIHVLSGCPPELHWLCSLAAHTLALLVLLLIPTLVVGAVFDTDHTLNQPDLIVAFGVILLIGCMAFFALTYLVSFVCSEKLASIILVAVLIIFGFVTPTVKTASEMLSPDAARDATYYAVRACGAAASPHALAEAGSRALNVARINAYCALNRHRCPQLLVNDPGFDTEACCVKNTNPRCYFCIDNYSPGMAMITLVLQFIVYMSIVLAMERGVFNSLCDKLFNWRFQFRNTFADDPKVKEEEIMVRRTIDVKSDNPIVVHDMHKRYPKLIGKSCHAVKGINFAVRKGECFGLLGVNGAGKSTTFKMLAGDECLSSGRVRLAQHILTRTRTKPLQQISYCPQFFGLDDFLTGKENLSLLLTLRGFSAEDVKRDVDEWIEMVGLEKYGDRRVCSYSGGCARRLGAAAALGGAAAALLDEPSAGVDAAARRRLWAALRRAALRGRALVVSSHSMDEMEALCDRIAIMSDGVVRALDTPSGLRSSHATGHTLVFKLQPPELSTPSSGSSKDGELVQLIRDRLVIHCDETDASEVHQLKGKLREIFGGDIKDEHKTMIRYHINDTKKYSELFTQLENLKNEYKIIEDYSVTETTLEEVFLSFSKDNRTEDEMERRSTKNDSHPV